jgi:pimeloyl-ACP methyl ester carboxylesterase
MKLPKYPVLAAALAVAISLPALAQTTPPNPAPDPGAPTNIFYGAIPPNANAAPVVIFIHGLGANASYWWTSTNSPYLSAYNSGYRTAFISLSKNNAVNTDPVSVNATTLQQMLPFIMQRYGVSKAYFVCHSKGGLDFQQAMVNSGAVRGMAKGVVTLATPNSGSVFAEWVNGGSAIPAGTVPYATWRTQGALNEQIAQLIDNNIQSPGLQSIATTPIAPLRVQADAMFKSLQIPFMTVTGNAHPPINLNDPGTSATLAISGYILDNVVTPGVKSDGLVSVPESKLPSSYAFDDATMAKNHVEVGNQSFPLVHGRLDGLEAMMSGFVKSATGGFGDASNTWAWSMRWFNGSLYVGTGRELQCVTLATAAARSGGKYPGSSPCPADPANLKLAAEIWKYTPGQTWKRVYQSPVTIPVNDLNGNTVMTAQDLGYRNLYVYTENPGTPSAQDVLYVGGVSPGCMFGLQPQYANNTFPPPRILRSTDGETFAVIPRESGTFLGDITLNQTDINAVSFRSFETYNGKLHAVVTNLRGEGFVVAADATPWLGNNHWRRVSPSLNDQYTPHVWALKAYNNFLYAPGGNRSTQTAQTDGYTVYKTDATAAADGSGNYVWTPVILYGGFQTAATQVQSPVALTVQVSNNRLYIGTNRRTELIRIRPGDAWDLIVGFPRQVPAAGELNSKYPCDTCPIATGASGDFKRPLSGFMNYFNNTFNAHFWQMGDSSNGLYLGTYDESVQVQQSTTINPFFNAIMGTDLLNTPDDGLTWKQIHYNGFYDVANFGTRSMEHTPYGLFVGTARNSGGTQIWVNNSVLDLNNDRVVDQQDVNLVMTAATAKTKVAKGDPRDLDEDGIITANDARRLATMCTFSGCISPPRNMIAGAALAAPTGLLAAPGPVPVPAGTRVNLTWNPVAGATRYHIYRMTQKTLGDVLRDGLPGLTLSTLTADIPGYGTISLQDIKNGKFDSYCQNKANENSWCDFTPAVKAYGNASATQTTLVGFPSAPLQIAVVNATSYGEYAPTTLQSNYWVRAEDAAGNLSEPSNMVGAPSLWTGAPALR